MLNFFRKLFKIKTPEEIAEWKMQREQYIKYFRVNLNLWNALIEFQDRGIPLEDYFSDGDKKPKVTSGQYPFFDVIVKLYFKGAQIWLRKYHNEKIVKEYKLPPECYTNDGWVVSIKAKVPGAELSYNDIMKLHGKIATYMEEKLTEIKIEADKKIKELLN